MICNTYTRWEVARDEAIYSLFSPNEWGKIIYGIHSDEEWKNYISHNSEYIKCYSLYDNKNNKRIAFMIVVNESVPKNIVSVHGGGWDKSLGLSFLYYRGFIQMIEYLLKNGKKVRTTCIITNKIAYKFLSSVGFVRYRTSGSTIYMWINIQRLYNSKIYKFLYSTKC